MANIPDISIILPCLNEESGIGSCIQEIRATLDGTPCVYEIVVCDNGSTDQSADIATRAGARVVYEERRGYGSAYQAGIKAAQGRYLVLADADGTYEFSKIPEFIKHLNDGADVVMGNRFAYVMEPGAMPVLHRYIGNPILSWLLRLWFGVRVRDAHCGMRALHRDAYEQLNLKTTGMEFASEMVMRAGACKLDIREVPLSYRKRIGTSKLRTFRDGWRHLRFMLLFAPAALYFAPGFFLVALGLALLIPMSLGPLHLGNLILYLHPMFGAALAVVLGVQLMCLGMSAKLFAVRDGYALSDRIIVWWQKFVTLERLLVMGGALVVLGFGISAHIVVSWAHTGYGALEAVRPLILSLTSIVVGCQIVFTAFFMNLLTLRYE